jgi:hypothetical protein
MAKVKKNTDRGHLSDAQLKSEIIKLFNNGKTGKTDLYGKLRTKWKLGRDRYFQAYDVHYKEWAELKGKAEEQVTISTATQAAEKGLKTKLERALFLQAEIDHMEKQLRGTVEFSFAVGTKIMKSHNTGLFMLPVQIQNEIRNTIKAFQIEISKMQGDYAPLKVAHTDSDGKDGPPLMQQVFVIGGKEIIF